MPDRKILPEYGVPEKLHRQLRLQNANYSVELTNSNECTYTHNFIVSDENQPKIRPINQTNNSIEVIASGGATPYLYYFNGVRQTSQY
ncbi:hypothetical protein LDL59_09365 [Kaistella anthropi]|nr:hypothetical protein [Kaistella anthropi]